MTLADWVGACAATLAPLVEEIEKHVLTAERIHADDTTVPVLAKTQCVTGRLWTYVRDDAPFGGTAAPAALFHYSPDRGRANPERHLATYCGIMQADAYSGYNGLYAAGRKPGQITEAACWAHGRRKLSSKNPVAKAIDYSLKRWAAFTRFLDDGRICLSNNAAERAVRRCGASLRDDVSPSDGKTVPSAARTRAAGAPPRSTPSSKPAPSTTSTRKPGSPTCWPVSRTTPPSRSPTCCPGTGKRPTHPPLPPEHLYLRPSPDAYGAPQARVCPAPV